MSSPIPKDKCSMLHSVRGYTLIEMLTVIAIIGILATIAIPTYSGYRDKARMSTIYSALRHVKFSQELFFTDNGRYFPPTDTDLVVSGPATIDVQNSDVKLYIPPQQTWALRASITTSDGNKNQIKGHYYQVVIETNMDRDRNGQADRYMYFKKADAGGTIIEESASFPLVPVVFIGE